MIKEILEIAKLIPLNEGLFKDAYKVEIAGKSYFLAYDKSEFECEKQIELSQTLPRCFPKIYQYGEIEGRRFSLEEWHNLEDVYDGFKVGYFAGKLFQRSGNVHFDPKNIQKSGKNIMFIDLGHMSHGNLHDLVGTFLTEQVGETSLEITLLFPDEFLKGIKEATGISLEKLNQVKKEVPTDYQY